MSLRTALVVGSSRGIGAALVSALADGGRYDTIYALSRTPCDFDRAGVVAVAGDAPNEASLLALQQRIDHPLDLLLHCVGALDSGARTPEKSLADMDPANLITSFAANVVPAALVLKHFARSLKRADASVAAVLSARVGSIGDNRLGGWYGYRASKAALNQIVHTAAIELRRGGRGPCVVAVHPGTTHTQLSERFVARRQGVVTADITARRILNLVATLDGERSGEFLNWDGTRLPW